MSDETGEAVRQWQAKAQSDWRTVEILLDGTLVIGARLSPAR